MTATTTTTVLVPIQPAFTDAQRLALAGFLAGYRGLTREAYALDLRQFTTWCRAHSLNLFAVRRADIESFARDLEARGRARDRLGHRRAHRRAGVPGLGRLDRHGAGRIVRKLACRAGITKSVTPHTLRHAFIIAALDAGCRCATCKRQLHMRTHGQRCGTTGPGAASTGTPPSSSPRTSRAPPGKPALAGSSSAWRPQPPGG